MVLEDLRSSRHETFVAADFAAVMSGAPHAVAIDIPIGLLEIALPGGRDVDVEARRLLGPRRASVFSPPTRPALECFRRLVGSIGGRARLHREVSIANQHGVPGAPGISLQTLGILPKIAEVDDVLASLPLRRRDRVHEAHPELCFTEANHGVPLRHGKKSDAGHAERASLLRALGFDVPALLARRPRGVGTDDLLDACIACWTARRLAHGEAIRLPPRARRDARGLRMQLAR